MFLNLGTIMSDVLLILPRPIDLAHGIDVSFHSIRES